MNYAESLRQQAKWIREALDPSTPVSQRIELQDIDTDELEAAADHIDSLNGRPLIAVVQHPDGTVSPLSETHMSDGTVRAQRRGDVFR